MPTTENLARYWLSPTKGSFWKWSDDGEVVCWADGTTLIFRRELSRIVSTLASDGLPPANALLLLLGACRPNWRRGPEHFGNLAPLMLAATMDDRLRWLKLLGDDLDRVSDLIGDRMSTASKAALAKAVFEEASESSDPAVASEVLRLLEGTSTELFNLRDDEEDTKHGDWWPDLRWVRYGLESFDVTRLEDYTRTGLDRLPTPPEDVDSPEFESVRELLASLENDDELSGLVRLTKRLMAAISLPRAISDPDELPVGGVSDIANRGAFDKLLLSELAADPDVLMTRVALNEALYLRRESPPRTPPESRLILLDAGIRMWGLPRVFATATALALEANADARTEVSTVTACESGTWITPFATREDLVDQLELLTTDPHPGNALQSLHDLMEDDESSVIIVTSPEAVADAEFRQCLDEAGLPECYIAAVSRSGEFELSLRRAGGSKTITKLKLDLESILEPSTASRPRTVVREDADPRLPAVLSVDPFPFRLPHPLQSGKYWQVGEHGVVSISHDRRLTLWTDRDRGPELLFDGLPPGSVFWADAQSSGHVLIMLRDNYDFRLVIVAFGNGCHCEVSTRLTIPFDRVKGISRAHSELYLIGSRQLAKLQLGTCDVRLVQDLPGNTTWARDRYFHVNGRLHVVGSHGMSERFELIPESENGPPWDVFECPEEGGPVLMQYDGSLVRPDGEVVIRAHEIPLEGPIEIVATHDRGNVVALREIATGRGAVVFLPARKVIPSHDPGNVAAAPELTRFAREHPLISRIISVTLKDEYLGFQMKSGRIWLNTTHNERGLTIRKLNNSNPLKPGPFGPLRRIHGPYGVRWRLRAAESADGSRVVIDSRGLIHLQSSNPDVPEISLAMTSDFQLAAWTTSGLCFGSKALIETDNTDTTEDFQRLRRLLREFTMRIRDTA